MAQIEIGQMSCEYKHGSSIIWLEILRRIIYIVWRIYVNHLEVDYTCLFNLIATFGASEALLSPTLLFSNKMSKFIICKVNYTSTITRRQRCVLSVFVKWKNEEDMAYIPFFAPGSAGARVGYNRNSRVTPIVCTSNNCQNRITNTDQTTIETSAETKNLEAHNRYTKYERNCNLVTFSHLLRNLFSIKCGPSGVKINYRVNCFCEIPKMFARVG